MGTVYEALQENPRRPAAVKVIRNSMASSEALRRFEREAQALARLRHPGIAQIYEAGTYEDAPRRHLLASLAQDAPRPEILVDSDLARRPGIRRPNEPSRSALHGSRNAAPLEDARS